MKPLEWIYWKALSRTAHTSWRPSNWERVARHLSSDLQWPLNIQQKFRLTSNFPFSRFPHPPRHHDCCMHSIPHLIIFPIFPHFHNLRLHSFLISRPSSPSCFNHIISYLSHHLTFSSKCSLAPLFSNIRPPCFLANASLRPKHAIEYRHPTHSNLKSNIIAPFYTYAPTHERARNQGWQ